MITIKTVEEHGGACPYQLEGTTDDGKWIYLRYRDGWLRYVVRETAAHWARPNEPWYDYSKKVGEDLDGWVDHETIYPHLKDLIRFPDGFILESYPPEEKKQIKEGIRNIKWEKASQ